MNGFLLIDKPKGITSAGCVYKLRKVLGIRKIGHCGTLDPLATGVLPICLGEATKFSNYITSSSKDYEVTLLLGKGTDTGDIDGNLISSEDFSCSEKELRKVISSFEGNISQIPPLYSAVKYKGKPMYYWARKGKIPEISPRQVTIEEIHLISFNDKDEAKLYVSCSKGTYIRSLAESIGEALGTKACVSSLRRTRVGTINENQLINLGLEKRAYLREIIPSDLLLDHLPKIDLDKKQAKKVLNGQSVVYNARKYKEGIVRIYEETGSFIGIGNVDGLQNVSPKRLISTN